MGHPRSDSGFALIEVIVAAAVLAMVALAVLAGVDGATSATGRERARAIAASLAEQDQERLRSMQIDTLSKYSAGPRTVPVDGVSYTVASTTRWVRDDTSATSNCTTGDTKQSDYLYITSTVTSNLVGVRSAPVTVQSIVTPPVKYSAAAGSLAVQVNDRDSVGVPNLSVSISGPAGATKPTDANGCVLFELVPEGDYTVTLNRGGWVDALGKTTSTATATVNRGTLTKQPMVYDQAAGASLIVKTYQPGTTTALDSNAVEISSIQSSNPMRQFPQPATTTLKHTISATNLFPFKTAYPFWTGSCASESPAGYAATYYDPAGGHALQTDAGGTYVLDVLQPPLNLRVSRDAGNKVIGGTGGTGSTDAISVKAVFQPAPGDTGCTDTVNLNLVANPYAAAANQLGWLSQSSTAFDPGIPFGSWNVCVWDATAGKGFRVNSYDNKTLPGRSATLDVAPSSSPYSNNVTATTPTTTSMTSLTKAGLGC
jgi:prepilin-type N-terminal cleavage/methylation domain-containing protein